MLKHYDRTALLILDGWGHGQDPKVSAIAQAHTPFVDYLYEKYPHTELITHGTQVGLPEGQMGNSEVGHLNIGAGRIVYQELARINKAIEEEELAKNPILQETLEYAKTNKKPLHLMGLLSDGGVHAHIKHLMALCTIAKDYGLTKIFIHAFTDGRDTDPKGGLNYMKQLLDFLEATNNPAKVVSIVGRYYAMDRDRRWERTKLAYDLLVNGKGIDFMDPLEGIQASYEKGITDEFIKPISCLPHRVIEEEDAVLCFNFRTDRCRQISQALSQPEFAEDGMKPLKIHYTTMTRYSDNFEGIHVLFEKQHLKNTLGEVLAKAGKHQLRIAETEKYPHVTFFFSGGREEVFKDEKRIIIPSPKVATYDLQPEMSALNVTDRVIRELQKYSPNFICLNYANTDMVGHTGVFDAAVKAAEVVDRCLNQVTNQLLEKNYAVLIIADHGNSDFMINADGSPNTAHTTNLVPCFLVTRKIDAFQLQAGKLADVAPTILHLMGMEQPEEMNGASLLVAAKTTV